MILILILNGQVSLKEHQNAYAELESHGGHKRRGLPGYLKVPRMVRYDPDHVASQGGVSVTGEVQIVHPNPNPNPNSDSDWGGPDTRSETLLYGVSGECGLFTGG